jgi:hypothetical protein
MYFFARVGLPLLKLCPLPDYTKHRVGIFSVGLAAGITGDSINAS